jgi:succinate dehydrogenase/fumarate reductase flavoprotein subunit
MENMRSPFPKELRERALQIGPLRSFAERAGDVIQWRVACAGILGGVAHTLFATKVNGLFVAGECSTGIHGADALPGMTTSYNLCSGEEAGIRAAKQSLKTERPRVSDKQVEAEAQRLSARVGKRGFGKRAFEANSEARIRRAMWDGAGPLTDSARLKVALKELDGMVDALAAAQAPSTAELRPLIRAHNLARLGTMVCQAALDHR